MTTRRFAVLLVALFLLGCSTTQLAIPTNTPEPPPTSTPQPTHTPLLPTNTPTTEPTNTATPPPTDTPSPSPTETETVPDTPTPDVPRFEIGDSLEIFGEGPAVPNDNLGPSGQQFTDPGGVIFHNGQFHMFHNSFTGWPAPVDIMYSVSDNGRDWTLAQDEPILTGDSVEFEGVAILASSAAILDDGRWALYFYTWDDQTWPTAASSIGMATAPGPEGPWAALDEPILVPGQAGEWDELAVRVPSVVKTEDGYVMYYAGNQRTSAAIGQATSPDGVTWTKVNGPIFAGSGVGWDAKHVYQPRVQQTADGWVMLYTSAPQIDGFTLSQAHGLALSTDGVNWIRSNMPLFSAQEASTAGRNIWFTELVYAQERYFYYFELGTGSETEIYVAEFDSALFSE